MLWKARNMWITPIALVLSSGSVVAQAAVWPSGKEVVALQAQPFSLSNVRLLDGPFRDAMLRSQKYLHELESDRLLWHFRKTAGLQTPAEPLGGWEQSELRGHTMGHYLSGCALMYASTSDEKLKAKADAIVTELANSYPIMQNGVEDIAFNHFKYRHGKYFSTAEIGKTRFYKVLEAIAPTIKFKGWQTAKLRKQYGIPKSTKKDEISPESHANDAVAMLCDMFGHFIAYKNAPFYYWQRPEFARRPLHRQHHQKGHLRPNS